MARRITVAGTAACLALGMRLSSASATAQPKGGPPRQFELKADSPKFWNLFAEDAKLEKVAGGFGFTEGPVWDPHTDSCTSATKSGINCRAFIPMGE